jgi:peptidoglycan/xylan/chitin deacetylase (PgdA/CDA1 family)
MPLFYKIPVLIQFLFPFFVWRKQNNEKKIYLTFDDGPIPEITPWILEQLENYQVKATFFVVGDNVNKHSDIFLKIIENGHSIGNHTFNHFNGWRYETKKYIENVIECENTINSKSNTFLKIFRPPYGKLSLFQFIKLKKMGYQIILWDVLSGDYNQKISPKQCLENVIKNVKSGSIIVFHDNIKAINNLQYVLPRTLAYLKENGYQCCKIERLKN